MDGRVPFCAGPGRPALRALACPLYLLAVFVVVHAGQCLVRVAIDVRVGPTHVPIPGPAHVTLGRHKGWELGVWVGSPHPTFFRPTSFWVQAHLPFPRKPPYQSLDVALSPTPFPRSRFF